MLGLELGKSLGIKVGPILGNDEGSTLGPKDGRPEASTLGRKLGNSLGVCVGPILGNEEGSLLGSFEGNDVASGLKWMLQSESVVLMPPPTRTSWAIEELLQPWVHYIPMYPNGSNAEEMVRWAIDNEKDAKRIAERATLFMYDLVYHPDADKDDRMIRGEIARRYRALWH